MSKEEIDKLMQNIASSPLKSLENNFSPKKKEKTPEDKSMALFDDLYKITVDNWKPKNFIDYFATKYKQEIGYGYKTTYSSDNIYINKIISFFQSNGMDSKQSTKDFIDWAFDNKSKILKDKKYFILSTITDKINLYFQDEVVPLIEKGEVNRKYQDTTIFNEIQKAELEGKYTEIFCNFGIPISVTYLINYREVKYEDLLITLNKRLEFWQKNNIVEENVKLEKTFKSSIMRSPYIKGFFCLDWRQEFDKFVQQYKYESWWRDEDYKGSTPEEYLKLIKKEKN